MGRDIKEEFTRLSQNITVKERGNQKLLKFMRRYFIDSSLSKRLNASAAQTHLPLSA